MRLLLDMNLSPDLCLSLTAMGHEAVHWSNVGEPTAPDETLMKYAREQAFVVISHDCAAAQRDPTSNAGRTGRVIHSPSLCYAE